MAWPSPLGHMWALNKVIRVTRRVQRLAHGAQPQLASVRGHWWHMPSARDQDHLTTSREENLSTGLWSHKHLRPHCHSPTVSQEMERPSYPSLQPQIPSFCDCGLCIQCQSMVFALSASMALCNVGLWASSHLVPKEDEWESRPLKGILHQPPPSLCWAVWNVLHLSCSSHNNLWQYRDSPEIRPNRK